MPAMYCPADGREFCASQNIDVAVKPNSTSAMPSTPSLAPVSPALSALASMRAFCSAASAL